MIIIHSMGNSKVGIGNIIRSTSLHRQIEPMCNDEVIGIYECNNKIAESFMQEVENFIISSAREKSKILLREIVTINKGRKIILITDVVNMTIDDGRFYRELNVDCIIQLNDSNVDKVKPDILINSDAFNQNFNYEDSIKVISGGEYFIAKEEVLKSRSKVFVKRKSITNVLVCFGGADPGKYSEQVVDFINSKCVDNIYFTFVLGPEVSTERIEEVHRTSANKKNISVITECNNIVEQIKKSDIFLSLGGVSAYESIILGTPVALIGWSYMDFYCRGLANEGIAMYCGNVVDDAMEVFLKKIRDVNDINDIGSYARQSIDGLGAKRILGLLKNI